MKILYTPLTEEDSEAFFRLAGNREVARTMRFNCPKTREESDRILRTYTAPGNRAFALRFGPGEALWGVFAFKAPPGERTADLSQMLLPGCWGRGLGRQVLRDMVELARENRWYDALEGYILETNLASRRMAGSCGFREKERRRFPGMKEDLVICRLELT